MLTLDQLAEIVDTPWRVIRVRCGVGVVCVDRGSMTWEKADGNSNDDATHNVAEASFQRAATYTQGSRH